MKLYGSVSKTELTYNKWYLEFPEYWSKDKNNIKSRPLLNNVDSTWSLVDPSSFDFYEMDVEWMEFNKVLDLRSKHWKEKILTFVTWYGEGWNTKGKLWSSDSPLDHIAHLGNYNVLALKGYLWVVCKHGPDKEGNFVELWQYIDVLRGPNKLYSLKKIDGKEFFK